MSGGAAAAATATIKSAASTAKPRKPSVRSLYDFQKTCAVPMACRNDPAVMIGYE